MRSIDSVSIHMLGAEHRGMARHHGISTIAYSQHQHKREMYAKNGTNNLEKARVWDSKISYTTDSHCSAAFVVVAAAASSSAPLTSMNRLPRYESLEFRDTYGTERE